MTDGLENTVSRIEPTGLVDVAIPVGRGASAVAVSEDAVWVVNSLDNTVSRIDPGTGAGVVTIPVGRHPTAVAVGADAVWVANGGDGTISRIDPKADRGRVVKTIEVGGYPEGIEADPTGATVYVACWEANTLERIDTATLAVTGRIPVGDGPRAFGRFLRRAD